MTGAFHRLATLFRLPDPAGPSRAAELLDRIAGTRPLVQGSVAIAVFVALSLGAMRGESCITDEVPHLSSGYTYLKRGDFRLNPEHPPLAKLLAALPLLAFQPAFPDETLTWRNGEEWSFGYRFLYHSGNDPDRLLFWSRVPMLLWPILLIASVFAAARTLFGPRGGLIALTVSALSPELLAHGHFVTTDVPVTAAGFLTVALFWKFATRPTLGWSLAWGAALGAALAVKYSAVMLLPVLVWLAGILILFRRKDSEPAGHRPRVLRVLVLASLALLTAYAVVWSVYGFRYKASLDPLFAFEWDFPRTSRSATFRLIAFARDHRLLPEAWLYGFGFMYENAQVRGAYALGQYSQTGWWWFFPFAFLVKTPTAALALFAWGAWGARRRSLQGGLPLCFLAIPLIVFWSVAVTSTINIGLRHVMPVYPFLFVLAGGVDLSGSPRTLELKCRAALLLLVAALAGCLGSAPYFLAHFNSPSLAIWKRHEMLVDSNLDWGQDLRRLKDYVDREKIDSLKLSYHGNASPRHLQLRHQVLPGVNAYAGRGMEPEWPAVDGMRPGDTVAVSATCLVGVFFGDREYYLRVLRNLKPIAEIGHSILVYRIPEEKPVSAPSSPGR